MGEDIQKNKKKRSAGMKTSVECVWCSAAEEGKKKINAKIRNRFSSLFMLLTAFLASNGKFVFFSLPRNFAHSLERVFLGVEFCIWAISKYSIKCSARTMAATRQRLRSSSERSLAKDHTFSRENNGAMIEQHKKKTATTQHKFDSSIAF